MPIPYRIWKCAWCSQAFGDIDNAEKHENVCACRPLYLQQDQSIFICPWCGTWRWYTKNTIKTRNGLTWEITCSCDCKFLRQIGGGTQIVKQGAPEKYVPPKSQWALSISQREWNRRKLAGIDKQ